MLIDRLESRLSSRKNRCLSYVGRLQLVVSVLSSFYVCWASVFMLPSSVFKAMEKQMRYFLWAGSDMVRGKVKVAWKDICSPKEDGSLSIHSLKDWNLSLMIYHIWKIVSRKDSLWVRWIHTYCLRGRSFWVVHILAKVAQDKRES
ncbi:hypothetical protein Patl1_22788 [Pistacia atlantica]|uniref:Uncharacterized protein n=1 Tax=Pistacia atlantica TaxID=434234 RepID=A0ACC1A0L1_9ROSI|nr:hypothetical protein Patl1_22788 [Pistacia atlantica]